MSEDVKNLRLRMIELFGLLEFKPKQIRERVLFALGDYKETGNMTEFEICKVIETTLKYVQPSEYKRLLERLVEGAEKIERMDPVSESYRKTLKLYNRMESLVRELKRVAV